MARRAGLESAASSGTSSLTRGSGIPRARRRRRSSRRRRRPLLGAAELTSQVAFTVSRVAHGTNDQSLEAWGGGGAICYRLTREGSRWFEGELAVSPGGADFQAVAPRWTPPTAAGEGDPSDVMGKALIAPLVERMLHGIRTGQTPSPSLVDGLRAQTVLDAVLESSARRGWVSVSA
jgi:predicted dehydrogenase